MYSRDLREVIEVKSSTLGVPMCTGQFAEKVLPEQITRTNDIEYQVKLVCKVAARENWASQHHFSENATNSPHIDRLEQMSVRKRP